MYGNNFCDFCKTDEDYSHYFITCAFFNEFWGKQSNLMKDMGIETTIFLNILYLDIIYMIKTYLTLDFLLNRKL
jgi:hypothetical protein